VRAHQKANIAFDELSFDAKLNCLVDEYARGTYDDIERGEYDHEVQFFRVQVCSL